MERENTWGLIYGASNPAALLDAVPPQGLTNEQRTKWYARVVAYLEVVAPTALGLPTTTPKEKSNVNN